MVGDPGYWIREGVFSDAECEQIIHCLANEALRRSRAGMRHLMSVPLIHAISNSERLVGFAGEILGGRPVPYKATLFAKTGKANWLVAFHQDTALPVERPVFTDGWGPNSVKEGVVYCHAPTEVLSQLLAIRVSLDASTLTNGPLRVIPNSHHQRLMTENDFASFLSGDRSVSCTTERGGIIAMSPLLLHASSKCLTDEPRRVLHIEYALSLSVKNDIHLAVA